MKGGEALVDTLLDHGVDTGFTVPGESFLTVLEAIRRRRNRFRLLTVRQEGGGAFATEAYGKLARRPAALFVSRGPGATNAAIGIHTARQDSTPLLLFVGHVRTRSKGREAFQEVDHHLMFASLAKAVLEPVSAADVAACTARAVRLSMSGRPGPVVVVLPRDITEAEAGEVAIPAPSPRPANGPDRAAIAAAADLIAAARRPIVIAGEMVAFEDATDALVAFAEAGGLPVMAAYRRQDCFPNLHPAYAGHLEINRVPFQRAAFAECDLIVAAGSRLDGITTEDDKLLRPGQRLVQIHPDPDLLTRAGADVAIAADAGAALEALASILPAPAAERLAWRDRLHGAYLAFSTPGTVPVHGKVDMAAAVEALNARLPPEATVLTDAGSFARWVHRYYRFSRPHTEAGPMSGAMGYGVPGALGAHLARPEAPTVAIVGDGGFLMTGQELATAVEHNLPVKVIVADNNAHGSILLGQVGAYGEEGIYATRLRSPNIAALARAYGAAAWTVDTTAGFPEALAAALDHPGPALVHLLTDERDIAPFDPGRDAV